MKRLSAAEAISPAIDHVTGYLGGPRHWRLILKVGAVACFAQLGFNFNAGFPHGLHGHAGSMPFALAPLLACIGVFSLIIGIALFYLGSRLQFTLFDLVLRRQTLVGPSWRHFAAITWRWMGLKVLFFLTILACLLPFAVPVVLLCIHHAHQANSGLSGSLIAAIAIAFVALFVLILAIAGSYTLLADFGLPAMALESASLGDTVRRVWLLFRAEPGQLLLYLLLRFLLIAAGALACEITLFFTALILLVPLGGASLGLWAALHHAALAGHIFMIVGWIVAGLLLGTFLILTALSAFGYLRTFLQAYALFFLAGRYPLLAQYLDPPPPPTDPGPDPIPTPSLA